MLKCQVTGLIPSGVTGYSQLASVTDSVNKDTVSGNENTGGIAGKISASGTADLYCKMETSDCKDDKNQKVSGYKIRYSTYSSMKNAEK